MSDFEEQISFVSSGIPIQKFKSRKTGLTIIKADIEGPVVQGYFTLATEAHDDDGCPHTLEHLVFMGSELYPYKGVLDRVANKNFADGTNAWTATDHTAYTLKTAGSDGFLNILPVFLDHILYPTLTDTACYTEVQHINGEGENSGVVYCEMQAVENNPINIVATKLVEGLFPGDSGYKAETGGRMKNLRSLTVETIRNFHRDYYRVDNLLLIVTGKVDNNELFNALRPVEERILSKGALPPMQKPWTDPKNITPRPNASVTEEIVFGSEDLSVGQVMMGWRGPTYTDFEAHTAIEVMWDYLTESAVAPLTSQLVETDDPYCTEISPTKQLYKESITYVRFSDVPIEKISTIKDFLYSQFKSISEKQDIDMARMQDIIHRKKQQFLESLEKNPHSAVCDSVITDFLYGEKPSHLPELFDLVNLYDKLSIYAKSQWVDVFDKYVLNNPVICVLGRPSAEEAQRLATTEEARLNKQREELGEKKLKELGDELERAMNVNAQPAPNSLFEAMPLSTVNSISFIPVTTVRNDVIVQKGTNSDVDKQVHGYLQKDSEKPVPFWIQFDHVKSSFVEIRLLLNTTSLPDDLRLYLELYLEMIYKCPIKNADGTITQYEDVVAAITRDTVYYSNASGVDGHQNFVCGIFAQYATFGIKLEKAKYKLGVKWANDLLYNTIFTAERIKVAATKLLNDIPKNKLEGFPMAKAVIRETNYDKRKSNQTATNLIRQSQFLNNILKKLETSPEAVCADLDKFRQIITSGKNLFVQVVGDVLTLEDPKKPWLTVAGSAKTTPGDLNDVIHTSNYVTEESKKGGKGYVVNVPSLESTFLVQTLPGPKYPQPGEERDIAVLMVLDNYLTMMEGPFWKDVRGAGTAYSFNIVARLEEGLLEFYLYRSSNVVKAYETSKKIIADHISGQVAFDALSLGEARSSTVYEIVSKETTVSGAAKESLLDYFRGWEPRTYHKLLKEVQTVNIDELKAALQKYIKPLFEADKTNISVATNATRSAEIIQGMTEIGNKLVLIEDLEKFFPLQ